VIAVNGSVPASRLASETGTAIGPLSEVAGPAVGVMGALYVILSLGVGSVFGALGLYLQTAERLGPRIAAGRGSTRLLAATPVVALFALLVAMLWFGLGSFIGSLSLIGTLVLPLLSGVFPMLLILAALHRGERVPGTSLRWLGHPLFVGFILAVYLGAVIAHALFIWTDPLQRLVAAATAVAMLALIVVSVRRHSFSPRTVVELRADEPPGSGAEVSVVADGRGVSDRRIGLLGAGAVAVDLPTNRPSELYVWAHRPTRDGDDQPLAADIELTSERADVRLLLMET
jgi:hypothetical protein